jgi:hypothetical protein
MTGFCFLDTNSYSFIPPPIGAGKVKNELVLELVRTGKYDMLVLEDITPQGLTGKSTIETIKWLGRFDSAASLRKIPYTYLSRGFVKKRLLGRVKGMKDKHVRAAVISRLYPQFTRKDPGPLKGVTADIWSALALGIVHSDLLAERMN